MWLWVCPSRKEPETLCKCSFLSWGQMGRNGIFPQGPWEFAQHSFLSDFLGEWVTTGKGGPGRLPRFRDALARCSLKLSSASRGLTHILSYFICSVRYKKQNSVWQIFPVPNRQLGPLRKSWVVQRLCKQGHLFMVALRAWMIEGWEEFASSTQ